MLVANGANVNLRGNKRGALEAAVKLGRTEAVRFLLENGAKVKPRRPVLLPIVSYRGHNEVIWLLLGHGADINQIDRELGTALQAASRAG